MPNVTLAADPNINYVMWDERGPIIRLNANIGIGHTCGIPIQIRVVGYDAPELLTAWGVHIEEALYLEMKRCKLNCADFSNLFLEGLYSDLYPAIDTLIAQRGLITLWEHENIIYRQIMSQVDIGSIRPESGRSQLIYRVPLISCGSSDLELKVTVGKSIIAAELHIPHDYVNCGSKTVGSYHTLCTYKLVLPITVDALMAMVERTLLGYLDTRSYNKQDQSVHTNALKL